jgi:DNA-binding LacI/PurR family transcriptional regulator
MNTGKARSRTRHPTSIDVARLAGVSRSAVSRAFTEGASVAPETRERVLKAAKALRYTPNLIARSLNTRRSMIVALAISHLDNQFYPLIVEYISEALGNVGYRLLLYITRGEESHEPLLDELVRYGVDGLILASSGIAPSLLRGCAEAGLPVVMMNNTSADSGVPQVTGDNVAGGRKVARFLAAGAHRCFAYLAGIPGVSSSDERLTGYQGELVAAGYGEPIIAEGLFDFDTSVAATRRLLARSDRPDAIFCANDITAFAAVNAAREAGIEPGRGLSIVGFDNVTISQWPTLALTTYSQPALAMATTVVDLLRRLMLEEGVEPRRIVPGQLIVRQTTRQPDHGIVIQPDGSGIWDG